MPVKLSSTGGGSVTLTTPSTASDFTVTIPAATGTMVTTTSASTIEFAAGSAAAPSITTTGDTNTGIYFPAADTIAFGEGGSEAMRINSSGNVGIGTSSPSAKLSVSDGTVTINSSPLSTIGYLGTVSNHPFGLLANNVERGRFDTSGNFLFNSGYGSIATAYGCRAWVNFNGTGVVAIRASGNVTSITDNGTGDYTVNFTSAMPDANYVVLGLGYAATSDNSTLRGIEQRGAPTTGSARIMTFNGINTSAYDGDYVNVAIFR